MIFDDRDVNIEEVLLQRGPLDGPQSKGMTEAQRQIYSDVIGTRRSPMQKLRKWWEDGKGQRATAMRQGFIDAQAPTDRQERELNDGDLKSAELSATKAAHSVAHTDRRVVHLLKNGMLKLETDADGKVEWFNIDETWTEGGLEDTFKDIAQNGQIEAWQVWAYANRAQRLIQEGKEKNMSQAQIDEALKLGEAHPEFKVALDKYQRFNDKMLDMAEVSGLMNAEQRAVWQKDDYVPFYRLDEDMLSGKAQGGRQAVLAA